MLKLDGPRRFSQQEWHALIDFSRTFASSLVVVIQGRRRLEGSTALARAEWLAEAGHGVWRRGGSGPERNCSTARRQYCRSICSQPYWII